MKKILASLFSVILLISISICAFAVSSPTGDEKENKYNISGIVTINEKTSSGININVENISATVDSKGKYTLKDITEGKHTLNFLKDGKALGTVVINIISDKSKTYSVLLDDGSYNIYVKESITNININFNFDEKTNKIIIKDVKPAGNDSPDSPQTNDILNEIILYVSILSAACLGFGVCLRRRIAE